MSGRIFCQDIPLFIQRVSGKKIRNKTASLFKRQGKKSKKCSCRCREVIPYLLASLVYHKSYLNEQQNRNPRNPLFLQRVWTSGILDKLSSSVEAGCNRNAKSKMFATGVPPHLVIANSIVGVQKEMNELRTEVIVKMDKLPEALKQSMLQNFAVDGTVPITHVQVVDMLTDLKLSLETSFTSAISLERASNPTASVTAHASQSNSGDVNSQSQYQTWPWKERFHPVPQDFRFPK
jgi:hypothetical protein